MKKKKERKHSTQKKNLNYIVTLRYRYADTLGSGAVLPSVVKYGNI